jgi:hypothetical protein
MGDTPMNEENPYQPPGDLSEPITSNGSNADDSAYYRTPPTFWVAWACMATVCVLALLGVFWLGVLALGVAFGLYAFLTPVFHSPSVATGYGLYGLHRLPAFVAGSLAIAVYLKLIQMSARRPRISAPSQKL